MVYLDYIKSKPGIFKIGTLVIGVVVLGIGCHSFFSSAWSSNYTQLKDETCHFENGTSAQDSEPSCPCPDIALEKFFVGVILTLFLFSLAHFLQLIFFKEMTEHYFRIFDIAYHILGGVLLIIGGSLYMYSAVKVKKVQDSLIEEKELQYYEEKIVAGAGALVNGLFYILAGVLTYISKDMSREKD